jgi:predicted ATP-grasp superfamily ATP-dependent carboligase
VKRRRGYMKKKILVLGTTGDDTNIIIRCLREVLDKYEITVMVDSRYKSTVLTCYGKIKFKYCKDLVYDESILSTMISHCKENDVVIPTGFDSLKFVSLYYEHIKKYITTIPLPRYDLIINLDDKFSFSTFCDEHIYPHPYTKIGSYFFENEGSWTNYPVLFKHRLGAGKEGINLVRNLDEAIEAKKSYVHQDDFVVQEFIDGVDIAFNGFCKNGELLGWSIQSFISTTINGRQRLRLSKFINCDKIFSISSSIVIKLRYSGPINIDFRYSRQDNKYYIIEVNPRFWANTHYSLIDGVNFVDIAINASEVRECIKPEGSGKVWGSPIKTAVAIFVFRKWELFQCLLFQSLKQLAMTINDQADLAYSKWIVKR